jgi:putative Ca2+/H+ antiporter (TMEM165/GDT1 family)
MLDIVAAAYVMVLFAELIGDKSIYTISSLCTRFGAAQVFTGISTAFGLKMAVAVLAGRSLAKLPPDVLAGISSATFVLTAIFLWRRKPRGVEEPGEALSSPGWPHAAFVSFGTVFLTEWADVGQITAAALTARFGHPLLVWSGVTAAILTKGAAAIALGTALRRRLSGEVLRYVAFSLCLLMAVLAATRIDL